MSPNSSSSSSSSSSNSYSSAAMDGVSPVSITSQETSQCPSIRAPTMLPLKSCLVRSPTAFQSQSASAATRPALYEIHGSSRLDNNSNNPDDISDAQAQRQHVDSRHRQNRQRRRLTFNNRTRIYLIPTIEELTTTEFAATYRTPDDDTASQGEIIRTIQAMAQHNFHDGDALPASLLTSPDAGTHDASADELTTRGLEHMRSSAHIKDRKETKLMVTDVILTEQEEQWDCGRTVAESEDDIADVSRAVTSRSVQEALERGAKDAAYVRRVVAHDLLCQQQQQQLGRGLDNLSLAADLPLASDTTSTAVPHQPTLLVNQAAPSPWSVASTPTTNTTNALLDQIASNASTATMSSKNKMPTMDSMPAAPALPPATTYLSRSAPI